MKLILNRLLYLIILLTLFSLNANSFELDKTFPLTEEEWVDKYFTLDWEYGPIKTTHKSSGGTVVIDSDESFLNDSNHISQYLYWLNGIEFTGYDLLISNDTSWTDRTYQIFDKEGYVKLDDWDDIDTNAFIKEKEKLYKSANTERAANGASQVASVKWLKEPVLYREHNAVEYSFIVEWTPAINDEIRSNTFTADSNVLILGRYGYIESNFVSNYDDYEINLPYFEDIKNEYQFPETKTYSDYKQGDKIAAYGIGGLVAASLGIKGIAKAGLMATLLLFLKKAWFLILIPFAFIGRLFKGKKS